MPYRLIRSISSLAAVLAFPSLVGAQQQAAAKASGGPDLSGVWTMQNGPGARYFGYTFSAQEPTMTPWAEERFKLNKPSFGPRAVEDSNDPVNPTTVNAMGCFPPGVPRVYLQPFPMEIIQTPGRLLEIFEFSHLVRQIWTDGRKHNTDLGPTWMGDSIGTWEGDTLVVDTIGFNDKTNLDTVGHPHSDAMHTIERFTRTDDNHIAYQITLEDQKAFTKPWTNERIFTLRPDWEVMEYSCEENNKDLTGGHIK